MNNQSTQKFDDNGEEILHFITVGVTQRQLDWINGEVEDYTRGPTPECLDQAAVVRSLIHCAIQADYEAECSRKLTEEIRARRAAGLPLYPEQE